MNTSTSVSRPFPWSLILIAAILGGLLSSWLSPKGIAWYFEPPAEIGINCRPATEWAMHKLIIAQVSGIVGGALVALVAILALRRKG